MELPNCDKLISLLCHRINGMVAVKSFVIQATGLVSEIMFDHFISKVVNLVITMYVFTGLTGVAGLNVIRHFKLQINCNDYSSVKGAWLF